MGYFYNFHLFRLYYCLEITQKHPEFDLVICKEDETTDIVAGTDVNDTTTFRVLTKFIDSLDLPKPIKQ